VPLAVGGRWALLAALFISAAQAQDSARLNACAGCHGADGNSAIAGTPSIAGQPKIFLENYLVMTREGIRGTQVMQALLKGVPDKEIVESHDDNRSRRQKAVRKRQDGRLEEPLRQLP